MAEDKPKGFDPFVRVTKRNAGTDPRRDKVCAECGRAFKVEPGQKFYLCPACYQKVFKPKRRKPPETQVLSQITCANCGKKEFLPFLPENPGKALCQSCFRAQEPKQP